MEQAASGARTSRPVGRARAADGIRQPPSPVPLHLVPEPEEPAQPVRAVPRWARIVRLLGRITVWSVPAFAVAVLVAAGHPGMPSTFAAVLGPLALVSVAAMLAHERGSLIAYAAAALGLAGATTLLVTTGTVLAGPHPPALALTGGILLGCGWLALGFAGLYARRMSVGDAILLMLTAAPLALGGALLDAVPRLAALLLLAAGIGMCRGVLDPQWSAAVRRPAQ